jgi:hypothetical protein
MVDLPCDIKSSPMPPKNIRIIRIRWQHGIERVPIGKGDTVACVIDKMGSKYGFATRSNYLVQEQSKTCTYPKAGF